MFLKGGRRYRYQPFSGDDSFPQFTADVTVNRLVALAHHCPNLSVHRMHFQADSLGDPSASLRMTPNAEPTASWTDCALTDVEVGEISVSEESVLTVALIILSISSRIETIDGAGEGWAKVRNVINRSKGIIDRSSKQRPFTTP